MDHLQKFKCRNVLDLPDVSQGGWTLKRYAVLADGRAFSEEAAYAAANAAFDRLPEPGHLDDPESNHGVGFQIVHFAQVAIVSPVFIWQWGSVLAHIPQMRAPWSDPTCFGDGVSGVFGCIWEMEIVAFEVQAWKDTMLVDQSETHQRLPEYLARRYP